MWQVASVSAIIFTSVLDIAHTATTPEVGSNPFALMYENWLALPGFNMLKVSDLEEIV
jgi:hypothetical protein